MAVSGTIRPYQMSAAPALLCILCVSTMDFGSLFAGIGGFDLGFERAGMKCKWQVENDKNCKEILSSHWPNVKRFDDVRKFVPDKKKHKVSLICAGFPCQDVSVAGKRQGLSGSRSGLFWEIVRVVSILHPTWLVLENVPGLLSSKNGRDMETIIDAVSNLGYCVGWRVLDSQWFGVAQRRRRVFFVCHSDPACAASVLFEPERSRSTRKRPRQASKVVANCLEAFGFRKSQSGNGFSYIADQDAHNTGMRAPPRVSGSLDMCEVCQKGPDAARFRMLGNAVTVPVAEWLGRRIIRVEKGTLR